MYYVNPLNTSSHHMQSSLDISLSIYDLLYMRSTSIPLQHSFLTSCLSDSLPLLDQLHISNPCYISACKFSEYYDICILKITFTARRRRHAITVGPICCGRVSLCPSVRCSAGLTMWQMWQMPRASGGGLRKHRFFSIIF